MATRVQVAERDDLRWWDPASADKNRAGDALWQAANEIKRSPGEIDRRDRYLDYARLLANQEVPDLAAFSATMIDAGTYQRIPDRWNVIESVWSAVQARIAAKVPSVVVHTIGGSRKRRKAAEQLTALISGLFLEIDYEDVAVQMHGDAAGFDLGALRLRQHGASVTVDRVFPWEVLIDPADGLRGDPARVIQEMACVDVEWAIETFELDSSQAATLRAQANNGTVRIVEGWKRASGKDAQDGRHVVGAESLTLLDEPYHKTWLPVFWHYWSPRITGTHGRGLVEQTIPYQIELNRMNLAISESLKGAIPRWVMPENSLTGAITDEANSYVEHKMGMPAPQQVQGKAMSREVYEEREAIWKRAHEANGISLLSATGQKPAGLDSGEAQRTYHDIESERFGPHANRWEKFHPIVARRMIEMLTDIYQGKGGERMKVLAPGTKLLQQIDFSEIDLTEDSYMIRTAPVNPLGATVAARAERLSDMRRQGDIDRLQYMSSVELPDDAAVIRLETAQVREIEDILSRIVDDGKYESPDEHMDLVMCVRLGDLYVSEARREGVSPKRVSLLRKFVDDAAQIMADMQASQAPTAQAQAAGAQQAQAVQQAQLAQLQPVGT